MLLPPSRAVAIPLRSFPPPLSASPLKSPNLSLFPPGRSRRLTLPWSIRCGLRGAGTRKPKWRSGVMSGEAIRAVHSLKLPRKVPSPPPSDRPRHQQEQMLSNALSRLLKADLFAVLAELQRQNEWELALQVFDYIRKEDWYQPDSSLYSDMIYMAGKNKLVDIAEALFSEIKKDGLEPDSRAYTEMIGVYIQKRMLDKAMELYSSMKESGCPPNELTFTILIRNLEKLGMHDLASAIKNDCEEFLESPEEFLEGVGKTYPRRRKTKLL